MPELHQVAACRRGYSERTSCILKSGQHSQVAILVFYTEAIVDHIGVSAIMPEWGAVSLRKNAIRHPISFVQRCFECRKGL